MEVIKKPTWGISAPSISGTAALATVAVAKANDVYAVAKLFEE
jgi:hypothetical protein